MLILALTYNLLNVANARNTAIKALGCYNCIKPSLYLALANFYNI